MKTTKAAHRAGLPADTEAIPMPARFPGSRSASPFLIAGFLMSGALVAGCGGGSNSSSSGSGGSSGGGGETPVNGACGSANGTTVSTAPTANFCSAGAASSVLGSGPWTWSCAGSNGGTTASCSASQASTGVTVVPHRMTLSGVGTDAYSLLLRADGSVVAAGNMPGGSPVPVSGTAASEITGAAPALAIASDALYGTSFVLQSGGTALGWGTVIDKSGVINVSDLGVGPSSTQAAPIAVAQLNASAEIKAYAGYVLARQGDGTVWIMPGKIVESTSGQPTTVSALQITGLNPIQSLGDPGAGDGSAIAFPVIDQQGGVSLVSIGSWSKENNTSNITVQATYTIAPVGGLPAASQVACADNGGGPVCLALGTDGSVWGWGSGNSWGQIGNGTTVGQTVPVQIAVLAGIKVTEIAVNSDDAYALADNGTVYAWGSNDKLGQPYTTAINNLVPNPVPNLTGIVDIVARGKDILALDNQGDVWGWGLNAAGELGTGNTAPVVTPTKFTGISLN